MQKIKRSHIPTPQHRILQRGVRKDRGRPPGLVWPCLSQRGGREWRGFGVSPSRKVPCREIARGVGPRCWSISFQHTSFFLLFPLLLSIVGVKGNGTGQQVWIPACLGGFFSASCGGGGGQSNGSAIPSPAPGSLFLLHRKWWPLPFYPNTPFALHPSLLLVSHPR